MNRVARRAAKTVFAAVDLFLPKLKGPRILIYHQVGADLGREMEVTESDFEAQLDWISTHGAVVDLNTALMSVGKPGADRLFVLTFDDGYRDIYQRAFPTLLDRKLPFLVYLTTRPVETGQPLSNPEALPLNWDQVQDMLLSGLMTAAAHTHSHPDLRRLDRGGIEREVHESDLLFELRLSVRPSHFAYPWGYWSEPADAVIRARYKTAALGGVTTTNPFIDPHLVPRIPVQRSDGSRLFAVKMHGAFRAEEHLRRKVRGYSGV
jgi:peptidoglycan/xylan/chitin deacetylase (PgdA/CDA1 family)